MVREVVLGNGNVLVCLDKCAMIRDFYYPYVGQENHVQGHHHRIGVWADGNISWLYDSDWNIKIRYKKDSLVSYIEATNHVLAVRLYITATVHHQENVYLAEITVENLRNEKRDIKLFLNQYFAIYGTSIGDTAFYHPEEKSIIFYKGKRYFLISGRAGKTYFNDYTTGKKGGNCIGTYVDAEDGFLCKNPIEHGSVDSTIGFTLKMHNNSKKTVHYWIIAGKRYGEVVGINKKLAKRKISSVIQETENYWRRWVTKAVKKNKHLEKLDKKIFELFKRSLLIIRAHVDNRGAIIASGDSDILRFQGYEDYSYVWPRDASFVAMFLDRAGYHDLTRKYFLFCDRIITSDGYMLHKYNSDGSAGSSWHSRIKYGRVRLPIQEDETAIVIHALCTYYDMTKDKAFLKKIYPNLIKTSAEFMTRYRYNKFPNESYDIWEEKFGFHTFTCCVICSALRCIAGLTKLLGKQGGNRYLKAAEEIKKAMKKHLYDEERKMFLKRVHFKEEGVLREYGNIDSSTGFGIFGFGIFDLENEMVKNTMKAIEEKLLCRNGIGGYARYEGDKFQRVEGDVPGNPWFICSLWMAQYYVAKAKTKSDLKKAEETLKWVVNHASPTGTLSEQLNPFTGEYISASPLAWSHAAFGLAVLDYLEKLKSLKK